MRTKKTYLQHFDVNEFQHLYQIMMSSLPNNAEKELIAFIGLTGSGKSTSVNFFQGITLDVFRDGLSIKYKIKEPVNSDNTTAQIGHDGSETLFPALYNVPDQSFALLDTAGLGDTRGKNVALCISLALKKIAESAKIKGIVIILRLENFTETRGLTIRKLFKLIAELTNELHANNIIFCVTGLTAEYIAHPEAAKRDLISKTNNIIRTIREELSDDEDPAVAQEIKNTIAALSLVTTDNLFLMSDLANPDSAAALRQAFFSHAAQMTGLKNGLQFTLDEVTMIQFLSWGKSLASDGLSLFRELKKLIDAENKCIEQMDSATNLYQSLVRTTLKINEHQENLSAFTRKRSMLTEERLALLAQQEQLQSTEHTISVPLPKAGRGVGGMISHHIKKTGAPRFEYLETHPHTFVLSQHPAHGAFDATIERVVTDAETQPYFKSGVTLFSRCKHSAAYQARLDAISRELTATDEHQANLLTAIHWEEQALQKIMADIHRSSQTLQLPMTRETTADTVLNMLQEKIEKLKEQQAIIQAQRVRISAAMHQAESHHAFLNQVIQHSGLDKREPIFKEFVAQYSEASVHLSQERSRACDSNVESLANARDRFLSHPLSTVSAASSSNVAYSTV